ncbi:carboxypeptidase regulatory-like domain-containing protein, partial [Oscillatoriales cyanobacterium LEGE 11467]
MPKINGIDDNNLFSNNLEEDILGLDENGELSGNSGKNLLIQANSEKVGGSNAKPEEENEPQGETITNSNESREEDPAPPVVEDPAPPVVENLAPPVVEDPAPPVVEDPAPPVVEDPAPPVVEDPIQPISAEPASLGDQVFYDLNGNGMQDGNDTGVAGVTVTLTGGGADGVIGTADDTTATTTTDENGQYRFTELNPGEEYQVTFSDMPEGYEVTQANAQGNDHGDSDADSNGQTQIVTLNPGENNTILDAGIVENPVIEDGTYRLFNHPNADATSPYYGLRLDGLMSGDDNDITSFNFEHPGAEVYMTIEGNNVHIFGQAFGGLDIGTEYDPNQSGWWQIDFTYTDLDRIAGDDDLGIDATNEGNASGTIKQLYGDQLEYDLVDFAGRQNGTYKHPQSFSIGNLADETGYKGFEGISGWGWLNHSGAEGHLKASDWVFTVGPKVSTQGPSSLGDKVFYDTNGDGLQDEGEGGVADVSVTLTGGGEDGLIGTADDTTATTTTDAEGNYRFDDLNPLEEYQVTFSKPEGYEFTSANVAGDDTADSDADPLTGMTQKVTLQPGEHNPTLDAGMVIPEPQSGELGALGDRVWNDANNNGIQDNGEQGVAGVTVNLLNGNNGLIDSVQTDSNGNYLFDDLEEGSYRIGIDKQTLPDGYELTQSNAGNDESDSDANAATGLMPTTTLEAGERDLSCDA